MKVLVPFSVVNPQAQAQAQRTELELCTPYHNEEDKRVLYKKGDPKVPETEK